jgi:phosphohistidine swiveling domain-containing protein
MDKKKEIFTRLHFAIMPLYAEAGKRLGFSLPDVRWFLWDEVKRALNGKQVLKQATVRNRRKLSVIKYQQGKPFFLKPQEIARLLNSIKKEEQTVVKAQIIKGVPASSGKVVGRIRCLKSARENHKIKKGEILLVSNTTPDFMPAIQKAVAIVTNEGGLTCHAAIVSRELKIPCVVGTKIATKAFKDGDKVEVDATKGIVRKLN